MPNACVIVGLAMGCYSAGTLAGASLSAATRLFVRTEAPVIALTHVKAIDGTGAGSASDQTIVIDHGRIQALGSSTSTTPPSGAQVLNLSGYTVIPGLVGMHEHLTRLVLASEYDGWKQPILMQVELAVSGPRLLLASGVTTFRTAGTTEPYTELNLKLLIDEGKIPGPKMHVTGPRLGDQGDFRPQLHRLQGPEDARRTINYWADEGVTSFKAYQNITREELAAAIETVHRRGLKMTGHLCSIGFREAIALGIDNLEHGIITDTDFVPDKQPDVCPQGASSLPQLDLTSRPVQDLIAEMVRRHVALTSTLPVFEPPRRAPLDGRVLDALSPQAREEYLAMRGYTLHATASAAVASLINTPFYKEMQFERAFVKAGGLLMAGSDPGGGAPGVIPGFGMQREVELLVEAGFSSVEAIHIATANGARFLNESDHIGTIEVGKQADLVIIHGDPESNINDLQKIEIVFKDGIGYDPAKLLQSVRGKVGLE
jgi:imidazolonepropionase-like amidohydrolase